ncbi:MAG: Nif3-like dinuclear metal center hexameric protein [Clostridia bacterium]|nr:Nif3-like dinuclear metal center hexameric protein [Clostridia bacterium]
MTVKEFYGVLNEYAPKALSDEYCASFGAYDNSGVLVDTGKAVKKALFSLDLSVGAIEKAKAVGANLIVTHHPAIYSPVKRLEGKLVDCIAAGISVISMHLNLDAAVGGIDESLAVAVALASGKDGANKETVMHPLSQGGYGRAYEVKTATLQELCEGLKRVLGTQKLWAFGDDGKQIKKAASFCGAGVDEGAIAFAKAQGADVVISADWKHHLIALTIEEGMAAVALTHYASEAYGFKKYYEKISQRGEVSCVYHEDAEML